MSKTRSVFYDIFEPDVAAEMETRGVLLMGLQNWLKDSGLTRAAAAEVLGVTRARVSDIKRGKINPFSLGLLVRLATRAGLRPELRLLA